MKTKKQNPPISYAQFKDFIKEIQLSNISLKELNAVILEDPKIIESANLSIDQDSSFANHPNSALVESSYTFTLTESEKDISVLELKVTYVCLYDTKIPFDNEIFALFSSNILPSHVWPYVREIVQNTVTRMNLPALTLPIWKSPQISSRNSD